MNFGRSIEIVFNTAEILEAEDRYELAHENDEYARERMIEAERANFSGLHLANKTRWNSDLKMARSQLQIVRMHYLIFFNSTE